MNFTAHNPDPPPPPWHDGSDSEQVAPPLQRVSSCKEIPWKISDRASDHNQPGKPDCSCTVQPNDQGQTGIAISAITLSSAIPLGPKLEREYLEREPQSDPPKTNDEVSQAEQSKRQGRHRTSTLPAFLEIELENPPLPGQGLGNRWIYDMSRQLAVHLPAQEIFRLLKAARPDRTDNELWHGIQSGIRDRWLPKNPEAFAAAHPTVLSPEEQDSIPTPSTTNKDSCTWPLVDLPRLDHIVTSGIGLYDLWEQSPYRLSEDCNHAEEVIDIIFPANLLLCCGYTESIFATRCRETWRGYLKFYALIVPSPMTAIVGPTIQDGRPSQHTKANTGERLYLVIEFDFEEFDDEGGPTIWTALIQAWRAEGISLLDAQAALLWHLSQYEPLVMVVHSGSKSLHAWFSALGRLEEELSDFMRLAVRLGADATLWRNRSQFVRMPEGIRANGAAQPVFFLNPQNAVVGCTCAQ
jgi:hypothetical protein